MQSERGIFRAHKYQFTQQMGHRATLQKQIKNKLSIYVFVVIIFIYQLTNCLQLSHKNIKYQRNNANGSSTNMPAIS